MAAFHYVTALDPGSAERKHSPRPLSSPPCLRYRSLDRFSEHRIDREEAGGSAGVFDRNRTPAAGVALPETALGDWSRWTRARAISPGRFSWALPPNCRAKRNTVRLNLGGPIATARGWYLKAPRTIAALERLIQEDRPHAVRITLTDKTTKQYVAIVAGGNRKLDDATPGAEAKAAAPAT